VSNEESRYELVSRRAMLKRTVVVGTIALVPGLACSSGDKGVTTSPSSPSATAPKSSAPGATTAQTSNAKPASGPSFPGNGQLVVKFTYTLAAGAQTGPGGGGPGGDGGPGGGARGINPYVVVWVEDATGALIRTLNLFYKAAEAKYINELRRWYTVDRARIAKGGADNIRTVSAATRVPGDYSLTWDGKNDTGAAVPQGDYFICIEAAREHGPYELIREQITIGTKAFEKTLKPNGELSAASVALVV
jgi:hypothetical protein